MIRIINKLKNRKGFTLIELIVVLAVLAIIMAIAIPRFTGVQENAKLNADYSTGEMIAKAAELYYIQNNENEVAAADPKTNTEILIDKGYLDDFKLQSKSIAGFGPSSVVITYGSDGIVSTVKTTGTVVSIYPRP